LSVDERRQIDNIGETSGLNSSEVLATLFDLERKGLVRQLPGKQFRKVLLQAQELAHCAQGDAPLRWFEASLEPSEPSASNYI